MDTGGCEELGSQHIAILQRYNLIFFQSDCQLVPQNRMN